jgi:hypothetical protein
VGKGTELSQQVLSSIVGGGAALEGLTGEAVNFESEGLTGEAVNFESGSVRVGFGGQAATPTVWARLSIAC